MKKFWAIHVKFQIYIAFITILIILTFILVHFRWILLDNLPLSAKLKSHLSYLPPAIFILSMLFLGLKIKKTTRPIKTIREGLETVGFGELSRRLRIDSNDEFSLLAEQFNIMAEKIESRVAELKKTRQNLEGEIQRRSEILDETYQKLQKAMEELKNTQQKIIQTEKQKSLTTIVAGFAHEINNPLTGILGYIDLMELRDDISPYLKNKLALIKDQSFRIKNILKELNQLNPEIGQAKLEIDLSNLLEKLVKTIKGKHENEEIRFIKQFTDETIFVIGNHFSLWQVFEGIIENAVEAIFDNHIRDGQIKIQLKKSIDKASAIVEVRDNAGGFENIDKAFDPFYTTKSRTQKKGIGLSIAYNIIQENQGNILISNDGEGAVITVYLPLASRYKENKKKGDQLLGEENVTKNETKR